MIVNRDRGSSNDLPNCRVVLNSVPYQGYQQLARDHRIYIRKIPPESRSNYRIYWLTELLRGVLGLSELMSELTTNYHWYSLWYWPDKTSCSRLLLYFHYGILYVFYVVSFVVYVLICSCSGLVLHFHVLWYETIWLLDRFIKTDVNDMENCIFLTYIFFRVSFICPSLFLNCSILCCMLSCVPHSLFYKCMPGDCGFRSVKAILLFHSLRVI
jgi:hypothetical protein